MIFWTKDNSLNQDILLKALDFAKSIHAHQKRKNGEPYIIHPISVGNILYEIGCGENLIIAGLLHDTLEDALDYEQAKHFIKTNFNTEIYNLVIALTKKEKKRGESIQKQYFTQIIEASQINIGVLFVKIADLLHNLSTIKFLKPEKKKKWISELLDGYLPILNKFSNTMNKSYQKSYDRLIDKMSNELSSFLQL